MKTYFLFILVAFYAIGIAAETPKMPPDYEIERTQNEIILPADTTECPYDANSSSLVDTSVMPPNYDSSGEMDTRFTLSEIRQMAEGKVSGSSGKVVAFADVRFSIGYEFSTRFFQLPKVEKECHYVDKILFQIRFESPPTILMPSELYSAKEEDGGVCFDQIYAHEMQHILDYERVFEDIVVSIEQDGRFDGQSVLPTVDRMLTVPLGQGDGVRMDIEPLIQDLYGDAIQQTAKEIHQNMAFLATALDSTTEYQRITDLCMDMIDYIK